MVAGGCGCTHDGLGEHVARPGSFHNTAGALEGHPGPGARSTTARPWDNSGNESNGIRERKHHYRFGREEDP